MSRSSQSGLVPRRHSDTGPSILASWLASLLLFGAAANAAAPTLLRTPGYESPVQGGPDDLLLLAGTGFQPSDRVVYQALDSAAGSQSHPHGIPSRSDASTGLAPIVQLADPSYGVVVRLPTAISAGRPYRLWVVNAKGEWSRSVSINDTRPLWITPAYAYATAALPDLGRRVRIVGRNLAPAAAGALSIRLEGPTTYQLRGAPADPAQNVLQSYVAEVELPAQLLPGSYAVSVRRGREAWADVPGQRLEVRADPQQLPSFTVGEPQFGDCHPDDGRDDSSCFVKAIEAAHSAGGGTVVIPPGRWDISVSELPNPRLGNGLVIPKGVSLRAAQGRDSVIVRHGAPTSALPGALLTLSGANAVVGITFVDADRYQSLDETRPVVQLGSLTGGSDPGAIDDVILSGNAFRHVGRAVTDSRRPVRRLLITNNEFGAYDNALYLPGFRLNTFHIDDAVIRFNRFTPGSYLDTRGAGSGSIATQLGGSHRLDFSSNIADGTSLDGLQDPGDAKGWGATFFWNISTSHELVLVAQNRISCSGDKAGNGEGIVYDDNGNTSGFNGAPTVLAAGEASVTVAGHLLRESDDGRSLPGDFYVGHWVQVAAGPGLGQTRRIVGYVDDPRASSVTLMVAPKWDVVPLKGVSRIGVGQQYWQVYTVANDIDQANPPCGKSNLSGPRGGVIAQWAHAADTVIDGNRQKDTTGILLQQIYSVKAPSCPECEHTVALQSAVEIRRNVLEGEYSWSSDCSDSGIQVLFGASATPESPPPVVSFGVTIAHNIVSHADGYRGGAIDVTASWSDGPPPNDWRLVESPLIYGNVIRDMSGPLPDSICKRPSEGRIGIRLAGSQHVRDAVLFRNTCERVDKPLADGGTHTARACGSAHTDDCECSPADAASAK